MYRYQRSIKYVVTVMIASMLIYFFSIMEASNNRFIQPEYNEQPVFNPTPGMQQPLIYAVDKYNQPFTITGSHAEDGGEEQRTIFAVTALFKGEDPIKLQADQGRFSEKHAAMQLQGDIKIQKDNMQLRANTAELFYNDKVGTVKGKVVVQDTVGFIEAPTVHIKQNYEVIECTGGRVKAMIEDQ